MQANKTQHQCYAGYHTWVLHYSVHHTSNLSGTPPAGWQQVQLEIAFWLFHKLNSYLHVLASGSNTSMVFKYVVPSKPPTAISCPFTTARPTCKTSTTDSSYLAGMSWKDRSWKAGLELKGFNNHVWWKAVRSRGFLVGGRTNKIA